MTRSHALTFLIATSIAMVVLFLFAQIQNDTRLSTFSLSLLPMSVLLGAITGLADDDSFSPLYMVLYLVVISVVVKTLFLLYFDSALAQRISLDGRSLAILDRGLAGISLGVVSLVAGYALFIRKRVQAWPDNYRSRRSGLPIYNTNRYRTMLLLCTGLFLFCFVMIGIELNLFADLKRGIFTAKRVHEDSVGASRRGSSLGYFRWGAITLPQTIVLYSIALRLVHGVPFRKMVLRLLVLLFIGSLFIPILTSGRLELIYLFLMIAMLFHYYRGSFRFIRVFVLAFLLASFTGFLGEARTSQATGVSMSASSATSSFERMLGAAYFMDVAKTSVVLDSVPAEVDYLYGRSLVLFAIAPVPRTLWREKPAVRISAFVGDEIYNRPDSSGIPPGFIAEAYLNFGFPGIVILVFILGALLAFLYKRSIIIRRSRIASLWYAVFVVILTFTLLSGDLTVAISQAVRYGLILFLLERIHFFDEPKTGHPIRRNGRRGVHG